MAGGTVGAAVCLQRGRRKQDLEPDAGSTLKRKGYNMFNNQDKAKANWVKTLVLDNNVSVSISDKGSLMLRHTDNNKFIMCLQPKQAELFVNISGDLANLLTSPEYKAILEDKEKNKEQAKIAKQISIHAERAKRTVQAAIDSLKAAGFSEEDARKALKVG